MDLLTLGKHPKTSGPGSGPELTIPMFCFLLNKTVYLPDINYLSLNCEKTKIENKTANTLGSLG